MSDKPIHSPDDSANPEHLSTDLDATAEIMPGDLSSELYAGSKVSGSNVALTVLVIDDSKTIRRSATTLLSEEGWHVVTAEDGFEALGKVVEHKPDIVFADIMMPRLDGYQACALIKNNTEYRNIPVVMLSSKDSIFDKARGRIAGSEHYLTKPFTRRELVRTVLKHTRTSSRHRHEVEA